MHWLRSLFDMGKACFQSHDDCFSFYVHLVKSCIENNNSLESFVTASDIP